MLAAQGDQVMCSDDAVFQSSWRMMRGLELECVPEWLDGVRGLWEGVLSVAAPGTRLELGERLDLGASSTEWRISRPGSPAGF